MKLSRQQVQRKTHALPDLRFEDQQLTSFAARGPGASRVLLVTLRPAVRCGRVPVIPRLTRSQGSAEAGTSGGEDQSRASSKGARQFRRCPESQYPIKSSRCGRVGATHPSWGTLIRRGTC